MRQLGSALSNLPKMKVALVVIPRKRPILSKKALIVWVYRASTYCIISLL
ncbi:uncharacterized protein PHALS_12662 [Plasmopara halstedii]|uniref:Uncharacterized protein n=1 Tax=Plasmopara halstedii TaxID=4781 RepID=A0A0P1AM39_PLAHL|nr:uncharacterized protein PHALS_12662 [Plasmopara halstedii]CEG42380.1 hypothetical protein PHALS_12662 [Plasmopara halstedii]|eukprot:XP_024578749.1 hypothetical protein PHALS_12662 [Plasmopara halstedii]